MPSSTSRSSTSSWASVDERVLLVERCPCAEGLGGAQEAADLDLDVVLRGDGELELETRCQPQLVDRVHVAGIGDRDAQHVALEGVRDGDHALHHVDGQLLGRLLVHSLHREVDERQVEAARERAGDSLR